MLNDRRSHEDELSLNRIAGTTIIKEETTKEREQYDVWHTFSSCSYYTGGLLDILQAFLEEEIETRSTRS
jgi:hypothetical protein